MERSAGSFKAVISVGFALILLIILGTTFYLSDRSQPEKQKSIPPSNAATSSSSGMIKDLLSSERDISCVTGSEGFSGEIYISQGMLRADLYTGGRTLPMTYTHIIMRNEPAQSPAYLWYGNEDKGYSLGAEDIKNIRLPVWGTQEPVSFSLEEPVYYSCIYWDRDGSKFAVPTGITLQDVGGQTQAVSHINPDDYYDLSDN